MEEQAIVMESLYEKAKEYASTNIELAKLKAIDKAADVVSALVPRLIVLLALLIFLFIANIAVALWLGLVMGRAWYGFAVVAAFYLLVAAVVHFVMQPSMKKNIANAVIARLLN